MASLRWSGLAREIHLLFDRHKWEWEDYGVPDPGDIELVLKKLHQHIEDLPDGTTAEIGRVMLKNDDNTYNVYIRMGQPEEAV